MSYNYVNYATTETPNTSRCLSRSSLVIVHSEDAVQDHLPHQQYIYILRLNPIINYLQCRRACTVRCAPWSMAFGCGRPTHITGFPARRSPVPYSDQSSTLNLRCKKSQLPRALRDYKLYVYCTTGYRGSA